MADAKQPADRRHDPLAFAAEMIELGPSLVEGAGLVQKLEPEGERLVRTDHNGAWMVDRNGLCLAPGEEQSHVSCVTAGGECVGFQPAFIEPCHLGGKAQSGLVQQGFARGTGGSEDEHEPSFSTLSSPAQAATVDWSGKFWPRPGLFDLARILLTLDFSGPRGMAVESSGEMDRGRI